MIDPQKIQELIEGNFKIVNKKSEDVAFKLNPPQLKFLHEMTGKDIILKARQEGFCLDPSTKVLTAQLRWKPLGDISIGERLVATDENKPGGRGFGRKLRTAVVEAKREILGEAIKITLEDGRILIATPDHRFMSHVRSGTSITWRKVKKFKVGDSIRYIAHPWKESNHEDYWFGGVVDGEAHFRKKKSGGVELCISQVAGPVYDRIIRYIQENKFKCRLDWDVRKSGEKSKLGNQPVGRIVFNRINEMFEILGRSRPCKTEDKEWWVEKDLPGKRNSLAWMKVIKMESLGRRSMIDLQTSTKTFIAEGFVSHNSSLILAIFTYDFLFKPNSSSISISYEAGAAQKLLDKVKHYIEPLGLNLKYNSRNEMYNADLNSTFYIGTAGAVTTGRGSTINNLHASEVAFYSDADTLMTGLLQSVPKDGRIILESTANGMGDYFHREWVKAINGDGIFAPHFFSWKEDPGYVLPDLEHANLTSEERDEMNNFGLSKEQILWKRSKKKEFKTLDDFNQEYPLTPEMAFISSGNPAFDMHALNWYLAQAKEPKVIGNLMGNRTRMGIEQTTKGFLKIWQMPSEMTSYVIGADVGETNDYSVATVLNKRTLEMVAQWHGHIALDAFAKELERLGFFYNTALIGVERNNSGIATLVELNRLYYPMLYYREDINDTGENSTVKLGWETNLRTRPIMLSDLGMYLRNRDLVLNDRDTINELMTFVRTKRSADGEAQSGCHDDRVMSLAIAIQMYRRSPATNSSNPMVTRGEEGSEEYQNVYDTPNKSFDTY